jgi:anti-sigma regulatory factor (Ser/Thr protein kinase)
VTDGSELRIRRDGQGDVPRPLRHALDAFLDAIKIEQTRREDIVLAVGEALSNAVEHGYRGSASGQVEIHARAQENDTLIVDVLDRGCFIERNDETPGRGFGLLIVRAIARTVSIDTENGTRVSMVFDAARRRR